MADTVGSFLGKYEILEEIGRGGFGTVYRAYNPALDHIVALKVLDPLLMRDPNLLERFGREAKGTARLRHPNIAPIHDVGESDGRQFIVMEYLPGRSLDKLILEQGHLPPEQALHILAQVAAALDYAHGKGVTHRDVKPSNIIVGSDEASGDPDHAVLTDFGLLRATDQSAMTSIGQALGTPTYMAPEQLDIDRQSEVGPTSDNYAFAIVAYELLAGRPPFVGPTPALMAAHLTKSPPPLTQFNSELPPEAWEALEPALAKDTLQRPQSAMALVNMLRRACTPRELTPLNVTPSTTDNTSNAPIGSHDEVAISKHESEERAAPQVEATDKDQKPATSTDHPLVAPVLVTPRRRSWQIWLAAAAVIILLATIAVVLTWKGAITPEAIAIPQVVEKVVQQTVVVTQVVEKPIEKRIQETVVVEMPVEKVVRETVVVEMPVEKTVQVIIMAAAKTPVPPTKLPPSATTAATPAKTTLVASPPRLISPEEGASSSGDTEFRWEPTGPLPRGAAYEVVWWYDSEDASLARGIAAPTTESRLGVRIGDNQIGAGRLLRWTVLVVKPGDSYQRLTSPKSSPSRKWSYNTVFRSPVEEPPK